MCWSIMYHENKISLEETVMDFNYNSYKKVNILEIFNYVFSIGKFSIQNKLYYDITYGLCACEFFNTKTIKLREEFVKLILPRMEIPCLEPCIYIKLMNNNTELLKIFTTKYEEACYCIKRTKE